MEIEEERKAFRLPRKNKEILLPKPHLFHTLSSHEDMVLTTKKACASCAMVLVVDDNIFGLITIKTMLKSLNCHSDEALNGLEGIHMIAKSNHRDCGCGPYKLVISDLHMPIKNGIEMIKEARKAERIGKMKVTKYIVLSGGINEKEKAQCTRLQVCKIFMKPLQLSSLKEAMLELMI